MNRVFKVILSNCLVGHVMISLAVAQPYNPSADPKRMSARPQPYRQNSASRLYDVFHYNLDLTIRPDPFYLQGRAAIHLAFPNATVDQIIFDLQGLQVDSVFHNNRPANFTLSNGELSITPVTTIIRGDSGICTIFYQGTPQFGLYRRQNLTGDTVIYSHNEPYDARFWFPCNDEPGDKATHILTIHLPDSYTVLSNGRKTGEYADTFGWRRTVWEEDYPIATYLFSLAAAPYHIVEQNWSFDTIRTPVNYYAYPDDSSRAMNVLTATGDMLSFFSGYIGLYPFSGDKYAMAEVPLAEAAAMENQTATTVRDAVMDDKEIIAHELAHQWWGDALTPSTFADIWLNEGFASYFDVLYTEYSAGKNNYIRRMENYKSLLFQDGSLSYPVYNPPAEYLFGRSVYFKGAWILHMLRLELGDDVFKSICRNYYQQNKYDNVITSVFIQMCEWTSRVSLDSFFNQWLNFGGLPNLYLSWHQDGPKLLITIQQLQTETVYDLNLDLQIKGFSRDSLIMVSCTSPNSEYLIPFNEPVQMIILDPDHKVLQINNTPAYYLPRESSLLMIYPNPIQNKAFILYQSERPQQTRIEIWNILGEKVATLKNEKEPGGLYRYTWDEINLSSGTYFCVLRTAGHEDIKKIVILK